MKVVWRLANECTPYKVSNSTLLLRTSPLVFRLPNPVDRTEIYSSCREEQKKHHLAIVDNKFAPNLGNNMCTERAKLNPNPQLLRLSKSFRIRSNLTFTSHN